MALTTANLNDIVLVSEVDGTTGATNNFLGQVVGINPDGVTFQVRGVSGHPAQFVTKRQGRELTATTYRYDQLGIGAKAVADPSNNVI